MQPFFHIIRLGLKEMISLRRDPVLLFLVLYCFTFSVYSPAKSAVMEVKHASIAIVDEDDTPASRRIFDAFLPPLFNRPVKIPFNAINSVMDENYYTFVVDIPMQFQKDLLKGQSPTIEVVSDATAMSQAGRGPGYIENIIAQEVKPYWHGPKMVDPVVVRLDTRARFNPNMQQSWFDGINQIINNISVLAIFLTGAAVLRERERGTIEHLLIMPLQPFELMFAKIWANGLVVVVAAMASLYLVVKGALGVPIAGSMMLFVVGWLTIYFR